MVAGANCHDSSLLAPTLEKLERFGFDLPERITVHLDAGYDSGKTPDLLDTLGCEDSFDRGVAGCVGGEGPADQRCPLGVHFDGAVLAAL